MRYNALVKNSRLFLANSAQVYLWTAATAARIKHSNGSKILVYKKWKSKQLGIDICQKDRMVFLTQLNGLLEAPALSST